MFALCVYCYEFPQLQHSVTCVVISSVPSLIRIQTYFYPRAHTEGRFEICMPQSLCGPGPLFPSSGLVMAKSVNRICNGLQHQSSSTALSVDMQTVTFLSLCSGPKMPIWEASGGEKDPPLWSPGRLQIACV